MLVELVVASLLNAYNLAMLINETRRATRSMPELKGSFSDQAGHFGSSWPGGGERPPIRYEDSWGDLGGPLDTQLLIYSYKKR